MKKKFILEPSFSDSINTICKKCGEFKNECKCNEKIMLDSTLKKPLQSKVCKINNKLVTSLYPLYRDDAQTILKHLKSKLGVGGNIDVVESYYQINLQGDVRDRALSILSREFSFEIK